MGCRQSNPTKNEQEQEKRTGEKRTGEKKTGKMEKWKNDRGQQVKGVFRVARVAREREFPENA